ncbi:MAG TPA: NEW3 domain-containing protein [Acidobacteriota bacterium]|nr:NEW3 domain-containing protein [Acidobacteriota bacterium]
MARKFTGFLWILFFVIVGAAFYLGFLFGFDQGKNEAAVAAAMRKPVGEEQPAEVAVPNALVISAGESYFSLEMSPGGRAGLDLSLVNVGIDAFTEIELTAELPEDRWSVEFSDAGFEEIAPGEAAGISVTISAPPDIEPGDYKIVIKLSAKIEGKLLFGSSRTVSIKIVE